MRIPGTYEPDSGHGTILYQCKVCGTFFRARYREGRQVCSPKCRTAASAKWHADRKDTAAYKARVQKFRRAVSEAHKRGAYKEADKKRPAPASRPGWSPRRLTDEQKKENRLARALTHAKDHALTARQVQRIRRNILTAVEEQLTDAHDVVMGTKTWQPTQARVFGQLLNKVVPDLQAKAIQQEDDDRPLNELSQEELEAIIEAARAAEAEARDREETIEGEMSS